MTTANAGSYETNTEAAQAAEAVKQAGINDVAVWLEEINCGQYKDLFVSNDISAEDIPFLKEHHLKEMGIVSVGDRLKIIDYTESFMRGIRNRDRQKPITIFKAWQFFPCFKVYAPEYLISESAIEITKPDPFCCRRHIDNVDITSIRDIKLSTWCGTLGYVTIITTDQSVKGKVRIRLSISRAREIFGLVKNLWELDQLKLGRNHEDI